MGNKSRFCGHEPDPKLRKWSHRRDKSVHAQFTSRFRAWSPAPENVNPLVALAHEGAGRHRRMHVRLALPVLHASATYGTLIRRDR